MREPLPSRANARSDVLPSSHTCTMISRSFALHAGGDQAFVRRSPPTGSPIVRPSPAVSERGSPPSAGITSSSVSKRPPPSSPWWWPANAISLPSRENAGFVIGPVLLVSFVSAPLATSTTWMSLSAVTDFGLRHVDARRERDARAVGRPCGLRDVEVAVRHLARVAARSVDHEQMLARSVEQAVGIALERQHADVPRAALRIVEHARVRRRRARAVATNATCLPSGDHATAVIFG